MSTREGGRLFVKILILAFFGFIFCVLLKHSFDYLDPDFGWHLKFGQDIAATGDVPRVNVVNYTIFGRSWVDHEWLSNLITYGIFKASDYVGVNVFFSLLATMAFFLQYLIVKRFFISKESVGMSIFFAIQFFAVFASLPSLGVRMQEFTLLFLAVLLFILYAYEKTGKTLILWALPPMMYLWSSLHGGFLLGLGLSFLFFVVKAIEPIVVKLFVFNRLQKRVIPREKVAVFGVWAVLSFLATLMTPYGLELYSFLTSYGNDFYLGRIFEWFHQFRYPFFYPQLFYFELVFLALGWWSLTNFALKRRKDLNMGFWDATVFFVLLVMALKSRRHFPLFAMFSAPILAALMVDFFGLRDRKWPAKLSSDRRFDLGLKAFLLSVSLLASVSCLLASRMNNDPWKHYGHKYPYRAVEFLKTHPMYSQGRLFNEFNWGGYLIWTWPDKQIFIDGRLPQMEYKGHSLLEEFYDFFTPGRAAMKLEEYGIEVVLLSVKKDEIRPNWLEKNLLMIKSEHAKDSPLDEHLNSSPDWELVYNDGVAKIFTKKH